VLCPRNFLVELATAQRSTCDRCATYLLYRQNGNLFVGTVAEDNFCVDAMRQGRHLEAALVSFGWLEEDRLLMEMILPNGLLVCYAGAPDALDGETDSLRAPLPAGDEACYAAAGYELSEVHDGSAHGQLRIWRAKHASAASSDFVEVKKTNHLRGACAGSKLAKYWMQAALGTCGGVLVATTRDSHDGETASSFTRYTLDELAASIPSPCDMWLDLAHHLDDIMTTTAKRDGAWTLELRRHRNGPLALDMKPGWHAHEYLHDTSHISLTIGMLESFGGDVTHSEPGSWQMEGGSGWSAWRVEGLDFCGQPGEVLHFKVAGYNYRVVFGPGDGEGVQENLHTGRRRKLRFISDADRRLEQSLLSGHDGKTAASRNEDDAIQQLCDMGFSRADVARCLRAARGNPTRAVQHLLSSAHA